MIETLEAPPFRDVFCALESGGAPADRALRALAHLSPARCLAHLAVCENAPPSAVTADVLDVALDAGVDDRALRPAALEAIATRYAEALTPANVMKLAALARPDRHPAVAAAVSACLRRHPSDPQLLRCALKLAMASGEASRADALLTRLGLAEPTPATAAYVHRTRRELGLAQSANARVALLSSYTIDQLVPFVDLECRAAGIVPEIYVAPFNSWTQDVLDERSGLRTFAPDVAFLSVSIDDLVPSLCAACSTDLAEAGAQALERVVAVAHAFTANYGGAALVVHGFHSPFAAGPLGVADGLHGPSRREWIDDLNARLGAALRALPRCYLFDIAGAALAAGASLADSPKMRHIAAMRLPPAALDAVARAYVRYVVAVKGLTKKCVVLDLDNTLWGGLAGEEGIESVRLGASSPGSEFVEFQEFLKGLAQRGILLAINSKNNPDDALPILRSHPAMVLREDAFSAIRMNWNSKHENMLGIAEELNIGLDSMVFVDDNPSERELMRRTLPEVLTVELPKDPTLYRTALAALPQLEVLSVTQEDRERANLYQTSKLRSEAKRSAASLGDYLRSLEISIEIAAPPVADLPRVAQLFARTNQFNATTRRYGIGDVEGFANDPDCRLLALSSEDRFGKHGLVAVALVRTAASAWEIDSFLMSCRVIGYGIETALLATIAQQARAAGAHMLVGEFIPTTKNAPVADLYQRHGFSALTGADEVRRWQLDLRANLLLPDWIELK